MSDKKDFWMVRAGEGAYLYDEFEKNNLVAIGWNGLGDLTKVSSPEKLKQLVSEIYSDARPGYIIASAGQVIRFKFEFKKGDNVLTYNPQERVYLVGEIIGDYEYSPGILEYSNIRKVKWIGKIGRDKLSTATKNTLGAISTLFKLSDEASHEISSLLKGKAEPAEDHEKEVTDLDIIREDMLSKAHEFIKDRIIALDWEQMQNVVAGLLRGMGYKTTVSAKGADRGRDILASPDGLGLEEPRIVVEVKHRSGQTGAQEIRSFTGGLRQGNKGLYVSTGGFTREARYEADRSTIPVTLIDMDSLVNLLVQYYDNLDVDTKLLVPLIKIFWPA